MLNMATMDTDTTVIASGNLATSRRTITGVLGQLVLLSIDQQQALAMLTDAGLPPRALNEPDFPISLQQELAVCLSLVRSLEGMCSPTVRFFSVRKAMSIENLGVLGMAMRHAATPIAALKACLAYPQLSWGHSRLVVRHNTRASEYAFSMQRPELNNASAEEIDRLMEYCLVLDLLTTLRNIEGILESTTAPLYICFPFPEPADWQEISSELPCPVHFSAAEVCLAYPAAYDDTPLPRSNPLVHKSYLSIANKLSQMLEEDFSLTERVTRWLWAYTPPLNRRELARLLSMSERNLTRQLGKEDTSYAHLLAHVQEERAKNFLRNPALSVTEIGYRLGYADPAAFSRAFTRWVGSSPLQWRNGYSAG